LASGKGLAWLIRAFTQVLGIVWKHKIVWYGDKKASSWIYVPYKNKYKKTSQAKI